MYPKGEDIEYECVVTCKVRRTDEMSSSLLPPVPHGNPLDRNDLTPQQLDQLMAVISNMETVKGIAPGEGQSPPPTDDELQQFMDYVGMGVVNQDRLDYEERKEGGPEPPKRSKQASQYFWRRHYLSIIQEEEELGDQSAASSQPSSRPASTYENSILRLPRLLNMSPLCSYDQRNKEEKRDSRESWESEMSVDSLTSINSILSEEGSLTSVGSFTSDKTDTNETDEGRKAYESLSCLLDSVPPPSNTPDSMTSQGAAAVKPDADNRIVIGMGSKFKQQLQEIETRKRSEGKSETSIAAISLIGTAPSSLGISTGLAPTRSATLAPSTSLETTGPNIVKPTLSFAIDLTQKPDEKPSLDKPDLPLSQEIDVGNLQVYRVRLLLI